MRLALEDGTILYGRGSRGSSITGEVSFNTSMFGYPELLTDPSYYTRSLWMTYPIIGSYGSETFDPRTAWASLNFESAS